MTQVSGDTIRRLNQAMADAFVQRCDGQSPRLVVRSASGDVVYNIPIEVASGENGLVLKFSPVFMEATDIVSVETDSDELMRSVASEICPSLRSCYISGLGPEWNIQIVEPKVDGNNENQS